MSRVLVASVFATSVMAILPRSAANDGVEGCAAGCGWEDDPASAVGLGSLLVVDDAISAIGVSLLDEDPEQDPMQGNISLQNDS
jgi:hypothetical protein